LHRVWETERLELIGKHIMPAAAALTSRKEASA
jgi:hypothetical protein